MKSFIIPSHGVVLDTFEHDTFDSDDEVVLSCRKLNATDQQSRKFVLEHVTISAEHVIPLKYCIERKYNHTLTLRDCKSCNSRYTFALTNGSWPFVYVKLKVLITNSQYISDSEHF